MPKILMFAGGQIHDFKGCGASIHATLDDAGHLDVTYVEEDLDIFIAPHLDPYDALVLYYTLGELTDAQKNGLLNWIAQGRGFIGIHSAADSFKECPEYCAMIGGKFITHPHYRDYQVSVADPEHEITKDLVEFMVRDEQYILDYDPRVHTLCSALYRGRAVPVAWTKSWGRGRVFYLALGHDPAACENGNFKTLLLRGVAWAAKTGA